MNMSGITGGNNLIQQTQGMRPQMHAGAPPPKPNSDEMISKMTSDLGLSDEQVSKLKSIFEEDSESDFSTSFNPEDMKTKMDAKMEKVKSILTPDQLTKFNNILENRQNEEQKLMSNFNEEGKVDLYL